MTSILRISVLLITVVTMTGCVMNPQTGNYEVNRTGVGLATGAVAGGLLGAAMGDGSYAIKGAILGAAIGGGTGYYLEKKHRQLQQQLANTDMKVVLHTGANGQKELVISTPSDVTFQVGSADIQSSAYRNLSALAKTLSDQPYRLEITGHTDNLGSYDFNKRLSYQRAESVGEYLFNSGTPAENISVRGASFSEPVGSNESPEGRAQNRRVEIRVTSA